MGKRIIFLVKSSYNLPQQKCLRATEHLHYVITYVLLNVKMFTSGPLSLFRLYTYYSQCIPFHSKNMIT